MNPYLTKGSALVVGLAAAATLTTEYQRDTGLRIETHWTLESEVTAFEIERDGEPMDGPGGRDMPSTTEYRSSVVIDKALEVEGGEPSKLHRTFESVTSEAEAGESGGEREYPLTGVKLELALEDGEVVAEVVDGDEPENDGALEGHRMTLALDSFLPEGEVAEGDSWSLDDEQIRRALGLDLAAAIYPRPEREEGEGRGGGRGGRGGGGGMMGPSSLGSLGELEWEGSATLSSENSDHDGLNVATIELDLVGSGDMEERGFGGGGRRGGDAVGVLAPVWLTAFETSVEVELEGQLLFATEGRHPHLLELEGTYDLVRDTERGPMHIYMERSGELSITVNITEEEGGEE